MRKGTRPKDRVPYLLPLFRERQGQHEHRTNEIDGGGFVWPPYGGLEGIRTLDLSDANRTLSQLSYEPKCELFGLNTAVFLANG